MGKAKRNRSGQYVEKSTLPELLFFKLASALLLLLLFLLYSLLSKAISQTHREIFPWVGQQKESEKTKTKINK